MVYPSKNRPETIGPYYLLIHKWIFVSSEVLEWNKFWLKIIIIVSTAQLWILLGQANLNWIDTNSKLIFWALEDIQLRGSIGRSSDFKTDCCNLGCPVLCTVLPNSKINVSHNKFQGYLPKKSLKKIFKNFEWFLALPLSRLSFTT